MLAENFDQRPDDLEQYWNAFQAIKVHYKPVESLCTKGFGYIQRRSSRLKDIHVVSS